LSLSGRLSVQIFFFFFFAFGLQDLSADPILFFLVVLLPSLYVFQRASLLFCRKPFPPSPILFFPLSACPPQSLPKPSLLGRSLPPIPPPPPPSVLCPPAPAGAIFYQGSEGSSDFFCFPPLGRNPQTWGAQRG